MLKLLLLKSAHCFSRKSGVPAGHSWGLQELDNKTKERPTRYLFIVTRQKLKMGILKVYWDGTQKNERATSK